MAPRLGERLAARENADFEKAMAASVVEGAIISPSAIFATSADTMDVQSLPLSGSDVQQVSAGNYDISLAKGIGVQNMTEDADAILAESNVLTDNSTTPALGTATQSSATSMSAKVLVPSSATGLADANLTGPVITPTSSKENFAGAQGSQLSPVPSQSGKESNAHSNAKETPAHQALGNVMITPGSMRDSEQETVQKRRVVPKRRAAEKGAGCYALGDEVTENETRAQKSVEASPRTPAKRKRVDADVVTNCHYEDETSSSQVQPDRKTTSAPPSKTNATLVSGHSKKVVARTLIKDENLEASSLGVQIVDSDDKDVNYSPSAKTVKAENADGQRKRYGLRRQKESGLLIEHLEEETRKVSIETVLKSDSVPILRSSQKAARKGARTSSSKETLQGKQTAKQTNATRAKRSLSHLQTLSEVLTKKRKIVRTTGSFTNKYRVRFGYTPFPKNTRPSQKLCYAVFDALKEHHERDDIRLERYPVEKEISSNSEVQGPMHAVEEVSFHNIVKTILSQATNNDNAQTVEQTLIDRFRYNFLGVKVKGQSPNYHAMRRVEEPVIARALASGGLHNIKAKQILGCLNHVYNWNMARATDEQQIGAENLGESADFVPGMLSIDYMMPMSLQEKFDHLVSMPGIGVKTAACILSFNFEYPVFAVDTHVFRLSRMLCWLPLNARHEDYAFMHLDKRIPDELKYGLHQAFWHHGQICVRCKKGTDENTKGWKETKCPIDRFVNRSRKDPATSKRPKPKRDEKKGELKKAKMRPTVYPHSKLTPQEAAELGYELRTIMIDDGFGVRRANFKGKPLLKWVLKSDHVAIGDTDRQATTEDIKNEIEDPEEVDENIPDAEMDEFAASADDLLDEDTDDVAAEVDVVEEDDLSDEDFDIEEV